MSRCCGCNFMPAYAVNSCGSKKKDKYAQEPMYLIPCNSQCGGNNKGTGFCGLNNGFTWLIILILVILQFGRKDECCSNEYEDLCNCQPTSCKKSCNKGFGFQNGLLFIIVLFFLCGGGNFFGGNNNGNGCC